MTYAAAVTVLTAIIDAVPNNGLTNGTPYVNTARPGTSHVREHLKWPMNADGTTRNVIDHVCRYSSAHLDTAARNAAQHKTSFDTAVIIAVARTSAYRYHGWTAASLNHAEVTSVAAGTANLDVHTDHQDGVATALEAWAGVSPRYMALLYYNAISFEMHNHHHLKSASKKLASTTITLSGTKDFINGDDDVEGSIFHDTFHPVDSSVKSTAARNLNARTMLTNLGFDNLRKRLPVKAPDSGVAINYTVLYTKALSYHHVPADLPTGLAAPANLATAVRAYETAADAAALQVAVAHLRALSDALAEPSAYLAGFILGKEAASLNDNDLDLRTAARTTTILGCPAYKRAASEFSGSFTSGKEAGFKTVPASTPSQVLPRCTAAVTRAGVLTP